MKLYLYGHDYKYAVEQMLLTMFPSRRPEYPQGRPEGDRVELSLFHGVKYSTASCRIYLAGEKFAGTARAAVSQFCDDITKTRLLQRIVKLSFFRAAVRATGKKPVWGALTGIRPAKLMSQLMDGGLSPEAAIRVFEDSYQVSNERAELCLDAAMASRGARAELEKRDICLYVGIPFCPTRCAYCSFVSNSVEKSAGLIAPFLEALLLDVDATAAAVKKLGLRPVSVYMGGGTPTTLSALQLDVLLARMENSFDLSAVRDFTVEAGRPDTITDDRLAVLKAHGVRRVSVNPQTMEDAVLEAIGRRHTAQDVLTALEKVRKTGGFQVNMDLIAGLPADSVEGFSRTLDTVLALAPENITVHTLSLKKGSRIMLENTPLPTAEEVGEMLSFAASRLTKAGYRPYYLYRQKFMSGGFENVGWAKPDTDNLYNICIMEELCGIISMGGGASTKLVNAQKGHIERVFAPKYPREYIEKIEKVCDKSKMMEFYNGLSIN